MSCQLSRTVVMGSVAWTALLWSTGISYGQNAPVILVSSAALTFQTGLGQSPPLQSVFVGSSGLPLTLGATASTNTGGNWLQYSFDGGTTPANLRVTPQTANLPPGNYVGQIEITASGAGNSPLTIRVAVSIAGASSTSLTVAPNVLNFTAQLNGNPPPAQLITVGPADSSVGFTVTSSVGATAAQWLQVTPVTGTTPQLLSVSVSPQGLTGGNYLATIRMIPNAQGIGGATVSVNLAVNALPTLNISPPTGFQYYLQTGSTALPQPQGLTLSTTSGALTTTLTATTGNATNWLVVGQTVAVVGTTAIQIPIAISSIVSTFPAGAYTGTIVVTAPGSTNPSVTIPVNLLVSPLPLITMGTPPIPFSYKAGTPPPLPQTVPIGVSTGPQPFTARLLLPPGQMWLTVSPDTGTLPASLQLAVDASGLSSGTYSGQVQVDSPGTANNPLLFPVTLTVSANGQLVLSPTELDFNFQIGMAAPASQALTIGTTGGTATYSVQTLTNNCGTNWITVTPMTGSAPGAVKVSVNTTGMATPTLCTGRVGLLNQTSIQTLVPIKVTVSADPLMNVTPRLMSFTGTANGPAPAGQTIQLTTTDVNNPIFYSALVSTTSGGNWLKITNSTTGQSPGVLMISADQGTLVPGTYMGVVEIRPTGLAPILVPVTLTVTSNIGIGVSPPSIAFLTAKDLSPGPQILSVLSQGGALPFFVTAQSGQNWLTVTPATGTTPAQLIVTANVTGLGSGTYDGTIILGSNQASNPTLTIPVSLVVGAAQSLSVTPMAMTFTSTVGDPAAPSQKITLTPSAGSVDFKATAEVAGSVPWLKVSPGNATAPAEVMVTVDPAELPPATYSGTVTITPSGLAQVVVTVNYTVAPPPLPSLTAVVNAASLLDGPIAPGEIVVLRGANTGAAEVGARLAVPASDGTLPLSIGDTQVLFDTYLAPILSLSTNEVTVVVPYEVAGQASTLIEVKRKSVYSNLLQIPVAATAPGVFTSAVPVANTGVILNADGTVNSEKNPALANTDIQVYYTGDGQTSPPTATNSLIPATPAVPLLLLTATVGGVAAPVKAYGPLAGSFAGLSRAVVTIPANLGAGAQALFLLSDVVPTQGGVFVYVSN